MSEAEPSAEAAPSADAEPATEAFTESAGVELDAATKGLSDADATAEDSGGKPLVEADAYMMAEAAGTDSATVDGGSEAVGSKGEADVAVASTAAEGEARAASDDAAAAPQSAVTSAPAAPGLPEGSEEVPVVDYDDPKSVFFKEGRWIVPKRENFPSVFCAFRVRVRIEPAAVADKEPKANAALELPREALMGILQDGLGFGKTFVRWDDARDSIGLPAGAREVFAALSGQLPDGCEVGASVKSDEWGISATIVDTVDTNEDAGRINALSRRLTEGRHCDALAFELPQLWIIPDPDFKAKCGSIGLYPGSYWMAFLKSWGHVVQAEIFFKSVQYKSLDQMVHLVVKFKTWEELKMCYTFVYERYFVHPKQKNTLRQPCCQLVSLSEFKAKNLPDTRAGARTSKVTPAARNQKAIAKTPAAKTGAVAKARTSAIPAKAKTAAKAKASAVRAKAGAPMTPMPGGSQVPRGDQAPAGVDNVLSPAEAMHGLSGRQLEAFKMVMSRMERLEKENQELMEILLQMQTLLQQQQQRNATLTRQAGYSVSGEGSAADVSSAHPFPPIPVLPATRAGGVAAAPKQRKAAAMSEESHYASALQADEEAPWKQQRKRPRRMKLGTMPGSAAASQQQQDSAPPPPPPSGDGVGLDAYHDALLGN